MVESDDCRGDHCGWVGVKEAGGLSGGMGCSVWLGLYGSSGSAGASKRNDVSRRALPRWHRARATMPGSGSRIVTVGNRAALLQYQTSAEDGVCPPRASLQLRASCLGRWRGGGGANSQPTCPLDGLPAASRRPVAGALPNWGAVLRSARSTAPCTQVSISVGPHKRPSSAVIGSSWKS